ESGVTFRMPIRMGSDLSRSEVSKRMDKKHNERHIRAARHVISPPKEGGVRDGYASAGAAVATFLIVAAAGRGVRRTDFAFAFISRVLRLTRSTDFLCFLFACFCFLFMDYRIVLARLYRSYP